jgi:glycosyltransferase involved in cell wall biosynthesis
MSLRLGFHYHVPAVFDGKAIHMPGYLGRFVDSLGARCQMLVCFQHSPTLAEEQMLDYRITSPNVTLVNIGTHASVPNRMIFSRRYGRHIKQWRSELDALLIRGPSPLLPGFARAAGGLPVVLLLVGDYLAGIGDLPQPRWRMEAIRWWARWNAREQKRVACRSLTFVNSRRLFNELRTTVPDLVETRTSTLNPSDFFHREDSCEMAPHHVLYTGRIDPGKGLLNMVEAIAELCNMGEDVILDLVGWTDKSDGVLENLNGLARELGVAARVNYHGYKALGPDLFDYYKKADIYLLASKSSFEGFPRSIWEALAHGLPVVATTVGSIPHFLEDGETALLVPPRKPKDIAVAVKRIIHDPALRRRLIRQGISLSRGNTLDARTAEMVSHIERWLEKTAPTPGNDRCKSSRQWGDVAS